MGGVVPGSSANSAFFLRLLAKEASFKSAAMDESPPPMDDVEIGSEKEDEEGDDLFDKKPTEQEPLFADTVADIQDEQPKEKEEQPPDPEPREATIPAPTLETSAAEESPKPVKKETVEAPKPLDLFGDDSDKQVC